MPSDLRNTGLYRYRGHEYTAIDLGWERRTFGLVCLTAPPPWTCLYVRRDGTVLNQEFQLVGSASDLEDTGEDYVD